MNLATRGYGPSGSNIATFGYGPEAVVEQITSGGVVVLSGGQAVVDRLTSGGSVAVSGGESVYDHLLSGGTVVISGGQAITDNLSGGGSVVVSGGQSLYDHLVSGGSILASGGYRLAQIRLLSAGDLHWGRGFALQTVTGATTVDVPAGAPVLVSIDHSFFGDFSLSEPPTVVCPGLTSRVVLDGLSGSGFALELVRVGDDPPEGTDVEVSWSRRGVRTSR
jgi:hypothetical protein